MDFKLLNQLQHRFYIDAGRGQQVIGERFAVKLGGLRVRAAHFKNFTHQRVAVGVRTAGS